MGRKNKNALYRGKHLKKYTHARNCADRRFEKFSKQFVESVHEASQTDNMIQHNRPT